MAYLTPLDQGSYAKKLRLVGASDGTLENVSNIGFHSPYGKIVSTDYLTYILYYYCRQEYLDLIKNEYFDVYTPDGYISDALAT